MHGADQGALHEHLDLAFTSHFDSPYGSGAAVVDINDLDGSQIELQSGRQIADLCFRPLRMGTIKLSLNAWIAPPKDTSSHGQTIAVLIAGLEVARTIKPR